MNSEAFVVYQHDYGFLVDSTTLLQELRKNGIFCDVVVKAGDQEFSAHRVILAAKIPYFHTMLTSNYKESKQREVIINGVDPSALGALIDFCYSGKIRINLQNVQELMQAADYVQFRDVKNACANFLQSNIQAENVFGIKHFADTMNCRGLLLAAEKFIKENFSESSKSKEFLQLDLKEMMKLILNKDKTCPEEKVFEAVMRWVKHGESERASLLPEILLKLQLTKISSEYLVKFVSKEKLIRSSPECLHIVDEAKDFHLLQGRNKLTQNNQDSGKFNHLVPITYSIRVITDNLIIYDIMKNEWSGEVTAENLGNVHSIGSLGNKFYIISTYGFEEKLLFYDFKTKKWSKGKKRTDGKTQLGGSTSLNDCIYVCGGIHGFYELSSSVECYSVKENSWTYVAPMLTKRDAVGVTSLNGYIYAIGGFNKQQPLDSCERYDPTSNIWTYIKPMLEKRKNPLVAVLNNKIYACSGCKNDSISNWLSPVYSCEVYDPDTDSWSFVEPMSEFGSNIHLRAFDGKLYAFKGHDGEIKVEIYHPENNSWTELRSAYLKYNKFRDAGRL